jgi:rod shape-determining protein MreB
MARILDRFYRLFSNDIGIDLGTANTLVHMRGRGIVIYEPSVVAVNRKTDQVVAVGKQAKDMLGRTPAHIAAVRPLTGGVISDFEVTEEMVSYLLSKAQEGTRYVFGPRVIVGVPSGITNVEMRAVKDAVKNAGAREVYLVEEAMAAAVGAELPVSEPVGTMVIDIGGGTTDIAIISLSGIVLSRNVRAAGDKLNTDIQSYVRDEFKILIGEKTAEELKIEACVLAEDDPVEAAVRGRDLVTGLPREIVLTDADVREAVSRTIQSIIDEIREALEAAPPEVISDIMQRGIYLTGGGALIRGLPELLELVLKIPVYRSEDPLTTVVRGTGILLEKFDEFEDVLIENEEAFTAQTE